MPVPVRVPVKDAERVREGEGDREGPGEGLTEADAVATPEQDPSEWVPEGDGPRVAVG